MNRGRCLCGGVTWELSAEPFQAFNCHCKMCRKAHGTAFGTYWFMLPDQVRLTGGSDQVARYRSSAMLFRQFCRVCGSVVPYPSDTKDLSVAPGGCHDHGKKSDCNIFVTHNAPWHDITGDLPRYDDYPPYTGYPRVEEEPFPDGPEGIVRGSCLCGVIEFHLDQPVSSVYNCHCRRCRLARAAPFATDGIVPLSGVRFVQGEERLKRYKVPEARYFTQVFCDTCGSKMPRLDPDRDIAIVPLGILDDDPGVKPQDHIFVAYKAQWHDITDDLPTHPEHRSA